MAVLTAMRCERRATCEVYAHGADLYDRAWSPVILPPAASVVNTLDLARAEYVLDVGAGTGALTGVIAAAAPDATIVSIDPAPEMLAFAVEQRGVTAAQADAMALPIQAGFVDVALIAYVLFMLPDPHAGLLEARRVLRPRGQVGTVTWANESPAVAAKVWDTTLDDLGVPAMPAHSNHGGLETTEAMAARLVDAGLRPLHVWYEHVEHNFAPEMFWRLRTEHGTNFVRLAALDDRKRQHVLDALAQRLAPLDTTDYTFQGTLVCAVAEKAAA